MVGHRWWIIPLATLAVACGPQDPGDDAPAPTCGDGRVDEGEACDDGTLNSNTLPGACRLDCTKPRCGDAVVDEGEVCDDGVNDGVYGGCAPGCLARAAWCGDGVINGEEICDDGLNDGSYGSCSADCLAQGPRCGDGVTSGEEVCDDGTNDGSYGGCVTGCMEVAPHCGDAKVTHDEVCDDGVNDGSYDGCAADCLSAGPRCGDGMVSGDEVCDDGVNDGAYGGCNPGCGSLAAFCGDGEVNGDEVCDDGVNDGAYGGCNQGCGSLAAFCGDGEINGDEVCDDGVNDGAYAGCNSGCGSLAAFCGDGEVNGDEVCDDGVNDGAYGGCNAGCGSLAAFCGDGEINGDEVCDDGVNDGAYGGCNQGCGSLSAFCGDGEINSAEVCDDGVNDGAYGGCNPGCGSLAAFCGDGEINGDEVCDDGVNTGAYGGCNAGCLTVAAFCGDGEVNGAEVCDDGVNDGAYGGCNAGCVSLAAFCGDGEINGGEVCDDGANDGAHGGCNIDCGSLAAYCGDGEVNGPEACDDGTNTGSYGGCHPGCTALAAYCGDAEINGDEACDDGVNTSTYGGCAAGCVLAPHCGDGVLQDAEVCDDGVNDGAYGGCVPGCGARAPYCGDGQVSNGEACDDGNDIDDDMCGNNCLIATCTDGKKNGGETGVDCGGSCPSCTAFALASSAPVNGATGVSLDAEIKLTFTEAPLASSPATRIRLQKKNGSAWTTIESRMTMSEKTVSLSVARFDPQTTYRVVMDAGLEDTWNRTLGTQRTVTFTSGLTFADGTKPRSPDAHPLADNLYSALTKPMEFLLIGGQAPDNSDDLEIIDPFNPNAWPQDSQNTLLWNASSGTTNFRSDIKKAVRFRGDADVRDEVLILQHRYGDATLSLVDPNPSANNYGRNSSYHKRSPVNLPRSAAAGGSHWAVAAGQADGDATEEVFVLRGDGDGGLFLWTVNLQGAAMNVTGPVKLGANAPGMVLGLSLDAADIDGDGRSELLIVGNYRMSVHSNGTSNHTFAMVVEDATDDHGIHKIDLWDPAHNQTGGWSIPIQLESRQMRGQYEGEAYGLVQGKFINLVGAGEVELLIGRTRFSKEAESWYSAHVWLGVLQYRPGRAMPFQGLVAHEFAANALATDATWNQLRPDASVMFGTLKLDDSGYPHVAFNRQAYKLREKELGGFEWQQAAGVSLPNQDMSTTRAASAGDLNGDGLDEYVTLRNDGKVFASGYELVRNPVDGTPLTDGQPARWREIYGTSLTYTHPGDQSLLVLADLDGDGIYARFTGHSTYLSRNNIIGVLAAPPCLEGIGQNTDACETTYEATEGSEHGVGGSLGVYAGLAAGLDFEFDASFFAGMTVLKVQAEATAKVTFNAGYNHSWTYSHTQKFTTGMHDDLVIFSTTPYDRYHYVFMTHPVDEFVGQGTIVNVPYKPRIYGVSRTFYNANNAEDDLDLTENYLHHIPGNIASYLTPNEREALLSRGDVDSIVGRNGEDPEPDDPPLAAVYTEVTEGEKSSAGQVMTVGTNHSTEFVLGYETDNKLGGCIVGVCGFAVWGSSLAGSFNVTVSEETSYGGSVGSIPAANWAANRYSWSPFAYRQVIRDADGRKTHDFFVATYSVQR